MDPWHSEISHPLGSWLTHGRIIKLQRFSCSRETPECHTEIPSPGYSTGKRSLQSIWLWRPSGLNCRSPTRLGEKDFTLKGLTQNLTCTRTQGKSSNLIGAWARSTCWPWRVSWRGREWLQLTLGTKTLVSDTLGNIQLHEQSWQLISWVISATTWPHLTASMWQCWDTSGQTTNWGETQPYPSADKLPKDEKTHSHLWIHPDRVWTTRWPRPSSTYQWAGISLSF